MKKLLILVLLICSGSAFANPPGTYQPLLLSSCNLTPVLLTSGSGTWLNNTGCSSFKIEVIAGGGQAAQSGRNGGSGGCFSRTNVVLIGASAFYNVPAGGTGGTSTVGGTGGDAWINNNTNSAPLSTTNGALAKGGPGGISITNSPICSTISGIGDLKTAGGTGLGTNATCGGGGGGAGGPNGAGNNGAAGSTSAGAGGSGDAGFGGAGGTAPAGNGGNGTELAGGAGAGGGSAGSCGATTGTPGNYGAASGGSNSGTAINGAPGVIILTPLG